MSPSDVMKLCTKFERSRALRLGVIAISVFDLMTLPIALRVALGYGINFHHVWLRYLTLTLKVRSTSRSKSVPNLSKIEQSPAELLIILRIFARYLTLKP